MIKSLLLRDINQFFYKLILPLVIILPVSLYYIDFTVITFISFLLFWFLIGCFGVEIGYHRYLSHNSFKPKKHVDLVLLILGVFGAQGSPIFWSNIHRTQHHVYSDTDLDPHTPKKGILQSIFGWHITGVKLDKKFLRKQLKDKKLRFISKYYYYIYWGVILFFLLLSTEIFLGFILASFVTYFMTNFINFICHFKLSETWQYKSFDTKDDSLNIKLLSIPSWGLSLHNNHHKYPNRSSLSVKSGEIDPASYFIRFLAKNQRSL